LISYRCTIDTGDVHKEIDSGDLPGFIVSDRQEGKALPRLSIPERYRAGVVALAALPEEIFVKLSEALKAATSAETSRSLASQIGPSLPSVPIETLSSIIAAVSSMQSVYGRAHVTSIETFVSDIWDAFTEDVPDIANEIKSEALKSRLSQLVDGKTINITSSKINELKLEVERYFCRARILTDVRTAFSGDLTEAPHGMTILHNLQIGYHDDRGEHKEFYVALDSHDLLVLREAIDRAETKKKTLEEMLARVDCKLFE
jgi:hypothetical protein